MYFSSYFFKFIPSKAFAHPRYYMPIWVVTWHTGSSGKVYSAGTEHPRDPIVSIGRHHLITLLFSIINIAISYELKGKSKDKIVDYFNMCNKVYR